MRRDKIILIGNLGADPTSGGFNVIYDGPSRVVTHSARDRACNIRNESNLSGSDNIGGTSASESVSCESAGSATAATAAPEAGGGDDDGGGDGDPEPERRRPGRPRNTRKTCNASPAGNLPAPSAAQSADALNQFDTRPAASFVRLPVVCSLYACSPATAWRWVKAGKIPAPVKLSDRVTAWRVGDLRAALAQLAA